MVHLTLAGVSEDRARLLLVDDAGGEYTLTVDAKLRAALRGEHARLGQLEIQMDSAIRPRDIQARIRAGESAESVAQAAQTTVEKIMTFAGPVLDERAHVAQRAQKSSVRRRSGEGSLGGGRTLDDAVSDHLRGLNVDPGTVEWDAYRREDGRWTLTACFAARSRQGEATFSFDMPGNYVTVENDDARWLVGEGPAAEARAPAARSEDDAPAAPRKRRLSAVPAEELPLGEDAIEMVSADEAADDETVDLTQAMRAQAESEADDDDAPVTPATVSVPEETAEPAVPSGTDESADDDDRPEEPPRRSVKKSRGRASVPSWDEIMFGGGPSE
ncbi:septation protein SepH [Nocardioides sp. LHG3406-4]|uniref:septation protein SepH n=1 Tax=Nocardioides sp. LHG3406-4 TaxID=2804575 RepID=UPI003CF85877